jgi:dipeptidyl-peptidase-3
MSINKNNNKFLLEQFADLRIMRYEVSGFEDLSLKQKQLVYYLSEAALSGRDIIFDQFYKHNLLIRRTLEEIVKNYKGDRTSEDFKEFMIYTKRVWFSNGIHHHYSTDKFYPEISTSYFAELIINSRSEKFPLREGENIDAFIVRISPIIFCPDVASKRINQAEGTDLVQSSASNFYEGVNQAEVEAYYESIKNVNDPTPISYGLNSKVIKENSRVVEKMYSSKGMYASAIKQIVFWLEKAAKVAESDNQKAYVNTLIDYYNTGDLKLWDDYCIAWTKDLDSQVDFVNGFIENYGDPLGMKATYESIVNFKDIKASRRSELLADNAQWFEDNSPIDKRFKKTKVKGVSSKVITAAMIAGDCYPSTPIGVNLPNPDWIRAQHGSKSVTIENITYAYDQASKGNGFLEEFYLTKEEVESDHKYGSMADNLHTDMHECLGHGSGQLLEGTDSNALKNYGSPLEESRADLFALYYMMDPKMVELGILPNLDAAKTQYTSYIRNGAMLQLTRVELGKIVEQAHMRCRKLIAEWCIEKGAPDNVIEKIVKNDKTYLVINDFEKLRTLFGELLGEIQRIKSEGDFAAGKTLIEKYAVNVDANLHEEVLNRFEKLNISPYGGFINPVYKPIFEGNNIVDIVIESQNDFKTQSLYYADKYSFLPTHN